MEEAFFWFTTKIVLKNHYTEIIEKHPGPLRHKFMGSGLPNKLNEADCQIIEKRHVKRWFLLISLW
jgi:hypothetical protein